MTKKRYEVWIYLPGYDEDECFWVWAASLEEAERLGREECKHHKGYRFWNVAEWEALV